MFCCSNKQEKRKSTTSTKIKRESFELSINQEIDYNQIATPPQVPKKLLQNYNHQPKFIGQTTKSESKLKDSKLLQPIKSIQRRGPNPFKQFDCYRFVEITKNTQFLAVKDNYTLYVSKINID